MNYLFWYSERLIVIEVFGRLMLHLSVKMRAHHVMNIYLIVFDHEVSNNYINRIHLNLLWLMDH